MLRCDRLATSQFLTFSSVLSGQISDRISEPAAALLQDLSLVRTVLEFVLPSTSALASLIRRFILSYNRWHGRVQIIFSRLLSVRFEVFTAVIMKNAVFWDVTLCASCKSRRFGGTFTFIILVTRIGELGKTLAGTSIGW
jgi:hypothetical protein